MLSRVADAIYWMNRYVERAENIARFVDVNLNLLLDLANPMPHPWDPIVSITGDQALFQQRYETVTQENVIQFLTFDRDYPSSILASVTAARENARSIREIISSEQWEHLNSFYFMVNDAANTQEPIEWHEFFSQVKQASHLFGGITHATMTHNEGWHFGQLGKHLERADKTTRILDVKYFILLPSARDIGSALDTVQWGALLRSASAYEMYRKRYRQRFEPNSVAGFLLIDREFPRSVRFCIQSAERSLYQITGTPIGDWRTLTERSFSKLRADLDYVVIDEMIQQGLHEFLDDLQRQMNRLDQMLFESFFCLDACTI
jgi:uncharacterized alpha-E superfamily protein